MRCLQRFVFWLFRLLEYRFSPRLADIGGTRFWRTDPNAILRPILQRLSEAEKPGLSIHPCFPLIIRLCRGHVSLWSRSFLTSARTQSRLPRSMADQKFPTLMSCQNRRKPKVSNFANDFKTQAPRENVSYFNVRSQAAATTGFLGLRFAPPQALNRAAPSAFNKR